MHMPHGTSLRMGRLGYQSEAQASLSVSYNSLDGYGASLADALTRPYPAYEAIGIRNLGGEYNQLATTLLQIENEFYGTIRPKRVIYSGERPLHALRERGVEYVEVRLIDLDPFEPLGIDARTMRFLDVFLLHCLLADSPGDTPEEIAEIGHNQHLTAARGREPGLALRRRGSEQTLVSWGAEDRCAVRADRRRAGRRAWRRRLQPGAARGRRGAAVADSRCPRRACWRPWSASTATPSSLSRANARWPRERPCSRCRWRRNARPSSSA